MGDQGYMMGLLAPGPRQCANANLLHTFEKYLSIKSELLCITKVKLESNHYIPFFP